MSRPSPNCRTATSKVEIATWLCQGSDFGESAQSLRHRPGQEKMPCSTSSPGCGFAGPAAPSSRLHPSAAEQVRPAASTGSDVSISAPPAP